MRVDKLRGVLIMLIKLIMLLKGITFHINAINRSRN